MFYYEIDIYFVAVIILISILIFIIFFFKYFEFSVFAALLAPFIAAFFIPNIPTSELESETGIGSYIRILILVLIGVVGFLKVIQRWNYKRIQFSSPFIPLFAIILFSFFSTTYSIDQNITIIRATTFLFVFLFCLGIYFWLNEDKKYIRILDLIYYLSIVFIVINLITLFALPSKAWWYASPNRFQGIFSQPNSLAAESRNFIIILFWKSAFTKKKLEKGSLYIVILILFLFILLSGSRTALLTTVIAFILWLIFNKKKVRLMFALFVLVLGFFILMEFFPTSMMRDETEGVTNLTGRDQFWVGALLLISEKPLLGYGYEVGGKIWVDPRFYDPKLTLWSGSSKQSLHNGYISTAIGIGLLGFIIWLFTISYPFIKSLSYKLTQEIIVFLITGIVYFITNFVETTIASGSILFWISWTIMVCFIVENKNKSLSDG